MSKDPMWVPGKDRVEAARIMDFTRRVNEKFNRNFSSYEDLYRWSIEESVSFWEFMWEYGEVIYSRKYDRVVSNFDSMLDCKWFEGARLNFAENLLRYRDDRTAIIFKGEGQEKVSITYRELYEQVAKLSRSLKEMGVRSGDRVAGYMPNRIETIAAMLAATSIGAIWSPCSPDFGVKGALDRFGQIDPKVLFTADGYFFKGKTHDSLGRVQDFSSQLPSLEKIVVVPYTESQPGLDRLDNAVYYDDFLGSGDGGEIEFEQLPFNHPVYILYTSGTTGPPKCIVHGAGGTLLQHLKELALHTDLKKEDTIFYFTTCGWMMWNWLVSSLALGSTILLYDGNPLYPEPGELFRLAEEVGLNIFGTSAVYLANLEKIGVKPGQQFDLSPLKAILSTGSPLTDPGFEYVYRDIKEDLCLSSISGGTDIVSCFVLGNPTLPVYKGEIQCRGLGMKVEVFDEYGNSVINQKGELVCTAPFPSMPVYFWNDPGQEKYKSAYFDVFPNVWHHGDYARITETGGVVIYGRSDATLKPGGVRIGTAEIYRQIESFPEVADSLVVGQKWNEDQRVILFVKMAAGREFTEDLRERIKKAIKVNASPRHVPAKIIEIGDIPYTINMKKVEIAVSKIIHGQEVRNRESLINPESLDLYKEIPELQD